MCNRTDETAGTDWPVQIHIVTSTSRTVATLRRDEQERASGAGGRQAGRRERRREGEDRFAILISPGEPRLVPRPSTYIFYRSRRSSVRLGSIRISALGSRCELPFHHPVDPLLNEASEVSPSSPSLPLSPRPSRRRVGLSRVCFSPVPRRSRSSASFALFPLCG